MSKIKEYRPNSQNKVESQGGTFSVDSSAGEVTQLLNELENRQQQVTPKLFEILYSELRRLAQYYLRNERPDHTLQATALVHEAYVRLVGADPHWRNRTHFFAIASSAMRRILVDQARAKHAAKRPDPQQRVDLDEAPLLSQENFDQVIALDRALERLSRLDAPQARVVELRYFGGLTAEETAVAMGISVSSVNRDWVVAKAWLHAELCGRSTTEP
jgi:RNA polymerase sigma factor (TIGR02999 family)